MLRLKRSLGGTIASGLFVGTAVAGFLWVFMIASKNPADSGESAIFLIFFAMPWIMMLPADWVGPLFALACFALNAFILYCLFGGLRPSRRKT